MNAHETGPVATLRISNYNADRGEHTALSVRVDFPTAEAAAAFAVSLPKTAQRRVFVTRDASGHYVASDAYTTQPTALVNFRRFVKAVIAAGFEIRYHEYPAGSWFPAVTEADIRAAFGLELKAVQA